MTGIEVTNLHKKYPDGTVAVEQVDLSIGDGEVRMLGPSGCGKTTTLRAMAGLERQTSGDIRIGGTLVNDLPPAERDIAMVFQFYALYPHLKTRDNLAFPLRAEGLPEREVRDRVAEAARMMQLEELLDRRPQRLSGGKQQRVALARASCAGRGLSSWTSRSPTSTRAAGGHAHRDQAPAGRAGTTMVYVTHDQVEAMSLGHRIAILNKGRVEQIGTPLEVYDRPASLFCAALIGSPPMNLIEVEVDDGALRGPGGLAFAPPPGLSRDRSFVAGVRPEALEVTRPGADRSVPARVVSAEALDVKIIYVVDTGGQRDVRVRMPPTTRFAEDDQVGLRHSGGIPPVYDPTTEELVA